MELGLKIETTKQIEAINTDLRPQPSANDHRTYSFEIDGTRKHNLPIQQPNQEPNLPQLNANSNSNHHTSKLALPTLVQYTDVATCRAELENIVRQIQELYLAGPIVNGWLESYSPTSLKGDRSDAQSMEYVAEVYSFEPGKVTCESPRPGYYLCGRDATGKKLSIICPRSELASVSMAIARYQKLQQLLKFKHYLETCIIKLNEELK